MAAIACVRSTLLMLWVSSPYPPFMPSVDLSIPGISDPAELEGWDGVARRMGMIARVATFRNPRIVDERI